MQGLFYCLFRCLTVCCVVCITGGLIVNDVVVDEIDDGEGEDTDGEADAGVEDGFFGFFELGGIAGGGHIVVAADEDINYGDKATNTDNSVDDADDDFGEGIVFFAAAGGIFDTIGDLSIGIADIWISSICW